MGLIFDFKKPVFIMGQGPSIINLELWAHEYRDLDVYWASFCNFPSVEPILHNIDKHINILYLFDQQRFEQTEKEVYGFLSMGGERVVIVNTADDINRKYPRLSIQHSTDIMRVKNILDGGSMPHFLKALLNLGFRKICLFGVDGAINPRTNKPDHYLEETYDQRRERIENPPIMRVVDTEKFNKNGKDWFDYYEGVQILNCNPNSHVNCFKKIVYEDVRGIYGKV